MPLYEISTYKTFALSLLEIDDETRKLSVRVILICIEFFLFIEKSNAWKKSIRNIAIKIYIRYSTARIIRDGR